MAACQRSTEATPSLRASAADMLELHLLKAAAER
jgi:hypothetical protein